MKTNNKEFEHYSAPETQVNLILSIASYLNASSMNSVSIDELTEDDSFTF